MRSSYGTTGMAPVLAAGVGIRHGWTWVLRAASFRLEVPDAGRPAIGIAITRMACSTASAHATPKTWRPASGTWAGPRRSWPPAATRRRSRWPAAKC